MKRLMGITLAAVSGLALGGCNDGSLAGRAHGSITQQNSQQVGEAISATITGTVGGGGGSSGSGSQKLRAGSAMRAMTDNSGDCYTVTGDESDADNDGIPLDATYTFDGCVYQDQGWTETWGGKETITDPVPDAATYDFGASYDLTAAFVAGSDNENDHLVGTETGAQACGAYTYVDAETDDYSGTWAGEDFAGTFADDLTYVFVPSGSDPNGGAGTETVDGSWSETFNGEQIDTQIQTTDPLVLDPSCSSYITAGTIVADSGTSSVTMTWNGCNQETIVYSGPQS